MKYNSFYSAPKHLRRLVCGHILIVLFLMLSACNSEDSYLIARAEIERIGLKYRAPDFIEQVKSGNVKIVKLFLAAGMSPNQKSGWRPVSALTHAASEGQTEVAKVLLQAGANVNEKADRSGVTPLEAAAFNGHADVAKLLIDSGANVHIVGPPVEGGAGPILITASCTFTDDQKLRHYLYERGEIASKVYGKEKNHAQYKKLRKMFEPDRLELVDALLSAGADVNKRDKRNGNTALTSTAGCGYTSIGRVLYNAGADINAVNKFGATALSIAAGLGHVDFVEFLLEIKQVDINKGTPLISALKGNYELYMAIDNDRVEIVKQLLKAGIDITQRSANGESALELAKKNGLIKIHDLLKIKVEGKYKPQNNGSETMPVR
ncbi:MAG: ankyrin repeat domain-containing protein [Gammaproteobacteria bacterium]